MLYIKRKETDPYFNIAAEEYVLKQFTEDCFMLWRNEPSIIVGKHQNAIAEINQEYTERNDIPVIRRISGGGTVFHDLGNLNFSFIKNGQREKLVDFEQFTQPIIDALASLGVEARFEGKNDLRVKGKKISGNAEHVHKNRVLHHGTLLFDSKLNELNAAIQVDPEKFTDKAVKSNRSIVTNIIDHLPSTINIQEFEQKIYDHIRLNDPEAEYYEFSKEDIKNIEKLTAEKYSRWDWNFGYSPLYKLNKSISESDLDIELEVKDGVIRSIHMKSKTIQQQYIAELEAMLIGLSHKKTEIADKLSNIDIENQLQTDKKNFINALF